MVSRHIILLGDSLLLQLNLLSLILSWTHCRRPAVSLTVWNEPQSYTSRSSQTLNRGQATTYKTAMQSTTSWRFTSWSKYHENRKQQRLSSTWRKPRDYTKRLFLLRGKRSMKIQLAMWSTWHSTWWKRKSPLVVRQRRVKLWRGWSRAPSSSNSLGYIAITTCGE